MKRGAILIFILLLVTLVHAEYIFNLEVEVIKLTKTVYSGENIIVNTNVKSLGLGSKELIDVVLSYEITDEYNNIIMQRKSTLALQTSFSQSEVFILPNNIKPGYYRVIAKVDYKGYNASDSDSFYVGRKSLLGKLADFIFIIGTLILIFGIVKDNFSYKIVKK